MGDPVGSDSWQDGSSYESYVGRWSRRVADEFVAWLGIPASSRWLDVGCGTGALTAAVLEQCSPAAVSGVEPSEGFRRTASRRFGDRVTLLTGDAQSIPASDGAFDAVVSGLVLNFVPNQPAALAEMRRVAARGATIAAYVWDYAQGMQFMRHFWRAAAQVDASAAELDEGARFPICKPDALRSLFAGSGLGAVTVRAIDIPTRFSDFDDFWQPFLGGTGIAPAYLASLDEDTQLRLRDTLLRDLPIEADGSIALTARAWAVRSTAG